MNVVGVSAFFHDAACCLIQDGVVVAAVHEERFTRVKGDSRLPVHAFRYCLEAGGLTPAEVDVLAFYEIPEDRWDRQETTGGERHPVADPRRLIERRLGFTGPVRVFPHHRSHAASALLLSPFERAAIFTADGVGEWTTTAYWTGRGAKIESLHEVAFPNSIGLFYGALTHWLGFAVNGGEGTVMALAAHGRPRFAPRVRGLLRSRPGFDFELDAECFGFPHTMVSASLFERLGVPPRFPGTEITEEHMDLAASVQTVVEELLLEKVTHLQRTTGETNLCLAGGVALNCVANGRLARESGFSNVFIQPAAGDAGGALGAAALATVEGTGSRPKPLETLRLGPAYDPRRWLKGAAVDIRDFEADERGFLETVVDALARGLVVGWVQGRMEFGPRALGARSILADPRDPAIRDRINGQIKGREWFRPFGLSARVERTDACVQGPVASPHMLVTCPARGGLGAVTHVDGSTRPQLVRREESPRFWSLLEQWEADTGCPALLNTSFNGPGEPLVCTPTDALLSAARCTVDALALDTVWIPELPGAWGPLASAWQGPPRRSARPDLYTF